MVLFEFLFDGSFGISCRHRLAGLPSLCSHKTAPWDHQYSDT